MDIFEEIITVLFLFYGGGFHFFIFKIFGEIIIIEFLIRRENVHSYYLLLANVVAKNLLKVRVC